MATPRRLLLIVNRVPAGGAEAQLVHLARGLGRHGHDVALCCIDSCGLPTGPLEKDGVEVVELGVRTRYGRITAIPRLARLARRADVVHCTMWDPSLWGRLAAIVARRPVVVADHSTDRSMQGPDSGASRESWIALHNRLLDRFTFATVACASSQPAVLTSEGVDPAKIVHIPNGIPVADEVAAAASGPSRKEVWLPESAPLVVLVGRLREEKNPLGALDTIRLARESVPDAQLVFVGDGPMRDEVERRAVETAAGEWTHFLGHRTDVPGIMGLADLTLLPSLSDAMPMVVLESMALGIPVIAHDVGDVRAVLGEAGACVPVGDVEALSAECVRFLTDPGLRAKAGENGRHRVAAFDASIMVRRYEALFDAACRDDPPLAAVATVAA